MTSPGSAARLSCRPQVSLEEDCGGPPSRLRRCAQGDLQGTSLLGPGPRRSTCRQPAARITRQRGHLQVERSLSCSADARSEPSRRDPAAPGSQTGFCAADPLPPAATMLRRLLPSRSKARSPKASCAAQQENQVLPRCSGSWSADRRTPLNADPLGGKERSR